LAFYKRERERERERNKLTENFHFVVILQQKYVYYDMFFKPQTDPYFQYNFIVRQEPTLNDITLCLLAQ
jgi:hypothetical protein